MWGMTWTNAQRKRSGTRGMKLSLSAEQRSALAERARAIGKTAGLKAVRCVDDDAVFPSVTAAAERYDAAKSTLNGHLNGDKKTCARKHFEWFDLEGATTIETAVV